LLTFLLVVSVAAPALAQVSVIADGDQAELLKGRNPQIAANKKLVFDFLRIALDAGRRRPFVRSGWSACFGMPSVREAQ